MLLFRLYSAIVLDKKRTPAVSVKIVGRALDDFSQLPAVLYEGGLFRCPDYNVTSCLEQMHSIVEDSIGSGVSALPPAKYVRSEAHFLDKTCRMQWLPVTLIFAIFVYSSRNKI